jgi:glutamyl-Q tRNA(Asp) synthetase
MSIYSRILRFAPSPNGPLHLGHAYSALLNADMAREFGGRLLLRVEDIDAERCRGEFEQAIYEDLSWLGVSWHGPVRRQSEHFEDYAGAIAKLEAEGLLYPSFESRREFALRLAMDAAVARAGVLTWSETGAGPHGQTGVITAAPQMWGDVVLARRETPTSYHLAVVLDDALQGVTDVVRGQDLFWSTSIHRLLQTLLGLPEPAYHHHKLVLDDEGNKLSKSTRSTGLRELRAAGVSAPDVRRMIGLGR